MYDISHYFEHQDFIINGSFFYYEVETPINDVTAVISRGANAGRESGKGLTSSIRAVEANMAVLNLMMSQVPAEPNVHSKFVDSDSDEIWEILSAEDVGSGMWRCEVKKETTTRVRGRFRR